MGRIAVFVVDDGPTIDTPLSPPPMDFPSCGPKDNFMADEFDIQTEQSEIPYIIGA
jgi:laccase